ncbi:MAG TPA: VTT domain-containing protein [Chthoniobacterales bacterium]|jgi:membrane protein DedA with SNARE-associated domain|nr:VTT domain-containing protein [Chthoniobacterales bacterium]
MISPAFFASIAIIALSFVSEDAATVSSALSIFGGWLSWPLGFVSCFAGIWIGDIGLYSFARFAGKNLLRHRWLSSLVDQKTIARCEDAFTRNSTVALIASRFVPGTRLPTYLAAGLFKLPLGRFALLTAIGALAWISGIFVLAQLFGTEALRWFNHSESRIAAIVLTALFVAGLVLLSRRAHSAPLCIRRWQHWEFWPAWLFYAPVALYYTYLALRYRSFTLPTAANPGMQNGGFVGESKLEILKQLHYVEPELVADAFLIEGATVTNRLLSVHQLCRKHKIGLPFILKPDVGQRGNGVCLIRSMREAFDYLSETDASIILQRYASGKCEAGVFYVRSPNKARGKIFSITEKVFPTITGDGVHTIEQLIRADSRASLIAQTYLRRFAEVAGEVLPADVTIKLVETGNHAQGCIFQDGAHLWTKDLEFKIDRIARRLPGFNFGRFDIRYENEQDFRAGRKFKIVELNGASSEATNIYDARNSLRSAYRTLFQQWRLAFEIGAANRDQGEVTSSIQILWHEWRRYSAAAQLYPCAS